MQGYRQETASKERKISSVHDHIYIYIKPGTGFSRGGTAACVPEGIMYGGGQSALGCYHDE